MELSTQRKRNARLSREKLDSEVMKLSPTELRRLFLWATACAGEHIELNGGDLIQQAFSRLLSAELCWNSDENSIHRLCEMIKRVAYEN